MTVDEIKMSLGMASLMIPSMTMEDLFGLGLDYDTSYDEDYDQDYDVFDFSDLNRVAVLSTRVDPDYVEYIEEDFGVAVIYLNPTLNNLEAAINDDFEMIVIDNPSLQADIDGYIGNNPEIYFVTLGFTTSNYFDNHLEVDYYDEELGYMAGYMAGLVTETNVIGFIGGLDNNETWNYEAAYEAGAQASNPNVTLKSAYLEGDADVVLAKEYSENLVAEDADVLYHHAGSAGQGMVDLAVSESIYFINHQSNEGEDSDKFLGTTLINTPAIVYDLVSNYGWYASYTAFGIYDGFLDLYLNLPEDIQEEVFQLIEDIQDGTIYIPAYY
jgi:basic membrane protein A